MLIDATTMVGNSGPASVPGVRCPKCRHLGTFEPIPGPLPDASVSIGGVGTVLGQRRCPNVECRTHLFIVYNGRGVVATYPPLTIEFDDSDVPTDVKRAFEEAILCHANGCYIAAGMMVRKTLESICHDRGAVAANLHDRLVKLRAKMAIPDEMFTAMMDLKLLGNDAAHVEARTFEEVGKEEVEDSIELTKDIILAVYQYKRRMERLAKYKKGASPQSSDAT